MSESSNNLLHEQVAKLAYEIWERNGRPTGTARSDWLLAEQFLEFGDPEKPPFGALALETNTQSGSQTPPNASDPRNEQNSIQLAS